MACNLANSCIFISLIKSRTVIWGRSHLQAPHSNVPLPLWHISLFLMPCLWQSHSQIKLSSISTSSVKPKGLILMVSGLPCLGQPWAVILMLNDTWGFIGNRKRLRNNRLQVSDAHYITLVSTHLVSDRDVGALPPILSLIHESILTAWLIGDRHSLGKLAVLQDHLWGKRLRKHTSVQVLYILEILTVVARSERIDIFTLHSILLKMS